MSTPVVKTPYRAAIDRITPYSPGKPIEEVARELGLDPTSIVKMASNENPLGPSPKATEAMAAHLRDVRLYPDSDGYELRRALAAHLDVPADWLIIGRGSDEVMHFLAVGYLEAGDEVVMGDPPFSMYEISTLLMGATPVKVTLRADYAHDLEAMAKAVTPATKLVYLANPHNPTGAMNTAAEVEAFVRALPPHVILVLDEAYCEYVTREDYPDSLQYVREGRNVIVMRTFSKIYALAGLRVGYGITARAEMLQVMRQVAEPFNACNLGQWAAIASLADPDQVPRSVAANEAGKAYLSAALARMGLPYVPTQSNFLLLDTRQPCRAVFSQLLRRGVIVRTGDIFGYPTMIRVTIGTAEENARFIAALEAALAADD
ncbi:MAG TPA: histidinol-phosphate transaminase [Armatimonadota bacterium]|nr:histidinol-phosphate transaminase [Armatimonadota bacterium]